MLLSTLVLVTSGGVVAQTYPDQLDFLRGADTTPQIELVLDTSGSMNDGALTNSCDYYYTTRISSPAPLGNPMSKLNLLKAVLTGCQNEEDGIIDRWANDVIFAIRQFKEPSGPNTDQVSDFFGGPTDDDGIPIGSNLNDLQAATLALTAGGGTPLALAYRDSARGFAADFTDNPANPNTKNCRQNYIVMMSDGVGNYNTRTTAFGDPGPAVFDSVVGQTPVSISDSGVCYISPATCGFPQYNPPFADVAARYLVRDSSDLIVDALPNVSNDLPTGPSPGQPIRTYTIGFAPPGDAVALLEDMAMAGEGGYQRADNYAQLDAAFTSIIKSIVPRAQVAFNPGTVQTEGLFSGNYIYAPTFQPAESGNWFGTIKKHCIMPSAGSDTCLFRENGGVLQTNPAVQDIYTASRVRNATDGGTGEIILTDNYNVPDTTAAVPPNPYNARNIATWRPGATSYIDVDASPTLLNSDTNTSNRCQHFALINKLYGFTAEVADCAANDYSPVEFDSWPLGDIANGSTLILRYSDECESSTSNCLVVSNANDGMLHVFRAHDGRELSALIPGEIWEESQVSNNALRDIMDQPNFDQLKRYFFDGGMRMFHRDGNGNGYIDNSEKAYLIAGLGRGGKAYYLWDVSSFDGDFTSSSAPEPRPLMVDEATGFRNLRDTWSAPWVGLYRNSTGAFRAAAMFASGHQRELDQINAAFAVQEPGLRPAITDSESSPHSMDCATFGLDAALCTPPVPATGCFACTDVGGVGCPVINPPTTVYCYDWPGYAGVPLAAPFNNGQPTGHDLIFGPFEWSNANEQATAYRVVFDRFDLQANDYMEFLDQNQNPVGRLTANGIGSTGGCATGSFCGPWIYSTAFYVRVVSDGIDSSDVTGWNVQNIEVIRRNRPPAPRPAGSIPIPSTNYTRPSVFLVDLEDWAGLDAFGARPVGNDDRQAAALKVRFVSNCDGLQGSGELCYDATGSAGTPAQPDLEYMVCPISAEPTVLQEGNVFRTAYVGDQCGQIWAFDHPPAGGWTVRRILRLNNAATTGGRVRPNLRSEDYRKIFTRLELVLSRCNGRRSVGVYFGTGNLQRAQSDMALQNQDITRMTNSIMSGAADANVFGVVWDSPSLPRPPDGLGLEDLEPTTLVRNGIANTLTGNAANGFFEETFAEDKVLRDPVVFNGVATWKVYSPLDQATECVSASGEELVYQIDNCTAAPIADGDGSGTIGDGTADKQTYRGGTELGGGLMVFTPPNGDAFISMAKTDVTMDAKLAGRPNQRPMQIYLWRLEADG